MAHYYPVFLDLRGKPVVVIGGGLVVERKVASLLASGATVTVVSPELTPQLHRLVESGAINARRRRYTAGDLEGGYLAVVGTDDREVNREAATEARQRGVLVNTVDDTAYCDFIAPAVVERGDLTVAISTNGRSPAMARLVREELESLLPVEYGALLDVLERVRTRLRRQGAQVPANCWQRQIDDDLRSLVRAGRLQDAEDRLLPLLLEEAMAPARQSQDQADSEGQT